MPGLVRRSDSASRLEQLATDEDQNLLPNHDRSKSLLPHFHFHSKKVSPSHSMAGTKGEHTFDGLRFFKTFFCHTEKTGEVAEQHHHHHNHHGTRCKEVFGYEDAGTSSAEKADGLFGYRDAANYENHETARGLFGYEDINFETGEKGRDLFGEDDVGTVSGHIRREVFGFEDAESESSQKVRQVFGLEEEEEEEDDREAYTLAYNHEKKAL